MRIIAVDDEQLALNGVLNAIRIAAPSAEVNGFLRPEAALQFADANLCDIAILDVEMAGLSGVDLARQLKRKNPDLNIIFATGFNRYMDMAFEIHASGYITKPVTVEKMRRELGELRRPIPERHRVRVQTFGNFEVYLDEKAVAFKYSKTKELLAYLVDRKGALSTFRELLAVLFEDDNGHETYLKSLRRDLLDTLDAAGCGDIIAQQWGKLGVIPGNIDCDYYDWCEGKHGGTPYRGEYMAQYSWAEFTNATLKQKVEPIQ